MAYITPAMILPMLIIFIAFMSAAAITPPLAIIRLFSYSLPLSLIFSPFRLIIRHYCHFS
jgi:hypothetical protein